MKAIIMCAALMVVGCNATPGNHYAVYVDPSFGEGMSDVVSNLTKWETAAHEQGLSFDIVVENKMCDNECNQTITLHPATIDDIDRMPGSQNGYIGFTDASHGFASANVFIGSDLVGATAHATWEQTILHEIGHSLDLRHSGKDTLMYYAHGDASNTITCADLVQYEEVHNTVMPKCIR